MQVKWLFCLLALLHKNSVLGSDEFGTESQEFEVTAAGGVRASTLKGSPSLQLQVEHSFTEDSKFSPREDWEMTISPVSRQLTVDKLQGSAQSSGMERNQIKDLIANGGFYRIRLHSNPTNPDSPMVMAAISACDLHKANFREEIVLHLDPHQNIIGMTYSAPSSVLARDCHSKPLPENIKFDTKIKVAEASIGQSVPLQAQAARPPPGLAGLQKFRAAAGGEDGKGGPASQSFLRRYWYIVVPLALIFLTGGGGGGGDQPSGGGGGQQQGGGGGGSAGR